MDNKPPKLGPTAGDEIIVPGDAASTAFVNDLIQRGEAMRLAPGAPLPPGVTHEIIGETPAGLPILKRRRFSAF